MHREGHNRTHLEFGQGEMMGKGVIVLVFFVIALSVSAASVTVTRKIYAHGRVLGAGNT